MAKQQNMPETKASTSIPVPKMKRGIGPFLKDVQREAKHISWPTRQESLRLTNTVLGVSLLIVFILFGLSWFIEVVFKMLKVL